jgi:hypothetical protein
MPVRGHCRSCRSSRPCVSASRDAIISTNSLGAKLTTSGARRTSSQTRSSASATGDSFAELCALEFDLIIPTVRRVHEVGILLLRSLLPIPTSSRLTHHAGSIVRIDRC